MGFSQLRLDASDILVLVSCEKCIPVRAIDSSFLASGLDIFSIDAQLRQRFGFP
jgi:hypothetical protein